jgi:endonuclease YncB( thermonuclease family)
VNGELLIQPILGCPWRIANSADIKCFDFSGGTMAMWLSVFLLALLLPLAPQAAKEAISGPVQATVVSVYDGDRLTVDARPWPGVSVRLVGIDTPNQGANAKMKKKGDGRPVMRCGAATMMPGFVSY